MAEVNGTLGNEYIELNNAATEATLQRLLAAVMLANKQSVDQVNKMAQKMGLDPASVAAANKGLSNLSDSTVKGQNSLTGLSKAGNLAANAFSLVNEKSLAFVDQLTKGEVSLSEFLAPLQQLPGALGTFAMLLGQTAKYQEANLKIYEQITQIGANFGGSLTDLRQAALNSYMSLTDFGNFVKSNGEALSKMGGSVNDGAKAFVRLSKDLISSELGTRLMSLGYSTDQINQAMASYISNTGGRTRQEMQNTQALAQATTAYLTELDALTQFTGASKDALAEEQKKASMNAAFQRKLAAMDEKERLKVKAAYDKAAASGIAGATDTVISEVLGLPLVTKASQTLAGVAPEVSQGVKNMTNTAMDSTKTLKDVDKEYGNVMLSASDTAKRFGQTGDALATMQGEYGAVMNGLIGAENKLRAQGITDQESYAKRQQEIRQNIEKQQQSQATDMAAANKALKEIAQILNNMFAPAVTFLTGVLKNLLENISSALKWFDQLSTEFKLLIGAVAALVLWYTKDLVAKKARSAAEAAKAAKEALTSRGASPTNPLYVVVVGRSNLDNKRDRKRGPPEPDKGKGKPQKPETPDRDKDKDTDKDKGKQQKPDKDSGKKSSPGKLLGKASVGGLIGGLLLDAAAEKAAQSGNEKTAAALDTASYAASGAGLGAMIGSIIPGLGTAIGGAIGGLAGAGYGAYQNFFNGPPKMAEGGIVSKPTTVVAGESGAEAIIPLHHLETLRTELQTLNKQSTEMIKFLKETAEYTKRTVDAVNGSSGDLFKF